MAGCYEHSDEPSDSGTTQLFSLRTPISRSKNHNFFSNMLFSDAHR
jgi:hypothetical protein